MSVPPGVEAWEAWRPEEAARRLEGVGVPWCVVGGWALDLWHGRETRKHEDLEIAIHPKDLATVRQHLGEFQFYNVEKGRLERLEDQTEPAGHQNWVLDEGANRWRMDVMLEPGDAEWWVYRKDESIRAPREFMVRTFGNGIPILMPAGVLLFKAREPRPKDESDFEAAVVRMDGTSKLWLQKALGKLFPGHAWIARLA